MYNWVKLFNVKKIEAILNLGLQTSIHNGA